MGTRVLSFHAGYGCRHRGRCCSSGWPIPVEAAERDRIEDAISAGAIQVARPGFAAKAARDSLLASFQGRCVFHDDGVGGGCRIHRALGHSALPLACRQFPRQSVRDPRGVSVTLSHYCPTAQDLLLNAAEPVAIIDNAPAFPPTGEYAGLTADPDLPPLLHPALAMDWESWWLFEALSVSLLSEMTQPLTRLGLAVEHARSWTVDEEPLSSHLLTSFARARSAAVPDSTLPASTIDQRIEAAVAAVPDEWQPVAWAALQRFADVEVNDGVTGRYLAAHAFANWSAYQGEGLRTWFRSIETAACLLAKMRDPGDADLILRHLADSTALTDRWKAAERESLAYAR